MPAPTMKTHSKLAALGALAVSAAVFGLWLLFVYIALPKPNRGMDTDHSMITVVSTAVIFAALIAVHVVYARQLFRYSKAHAE